MTLQQDSPAEMKAYHDTVIEEFRANGGRLGGQFAGAPLLLLTTTGAKTGKPRTTPLTYTRDYSRFVIIAAKRGAPTNPDWYHNLVANPNVTVEVGDEKFRAVARVAEGEERQRLFDQMASQRPNFTEFQSKTTRQLPVIVLERVLDTQTDYNAFNRSFIEEFRARGGKVGGIFEGLPVLLLTTIGAKSGKQRIAPVLYGVENGNPVIVASKGGSPTNPDWYHNLVANPNVTVELGTESYSARARITEGAERQRLFAMLEGVIPMLAETQANTPRQLPIVVLERTNDVYAEMNPKFIAEFHANQGKVGGVYEGLPLLLLTTTGAKSGLPRIAPLVYVPDGDQLLIIASKGGSPANPDWVHNLLANPEVTVERGTESFPARATSAEGPERQRLFEKIVTRIPYFAEAQRKSPREFPIFVLERSG